MKPRDFLNFIKTKSGKLVTFAVAFGLALVVLSNCRSRHQDPENPVSTTPLSTNLTDKPQVVETIQRPLETFRPPPPKPEPAQLEKMAMTNGQYQAFTNAPSRSTTVHPSESLAPISLLPDNAAGIPEPKSLSDVFAPYGRLIACETLITVDSASMQTPIIGLTTEDIYHAGKLVIPAGTEADREAARQTRMRIYAAIQRRMAEENRRAARAAEAQP